MIFGLPAILGFLPMVLYIVLSFKGKDMLTVVLLCVGLGAVLTGQNLLSIGTALNSALGSFMGLIGFIILMGSGLGHLLTKAKVAQNIVHLVVTKTGVKNQTQAMVATMFSSVLLVAMLGSMAGSNAILAPIMIPIVASFGITPNALGVLLHGAGATGLLLGPFVPSVVTTMELTGISYGSYLLHVGIPISAIIWISTFFIAKKTQKRYQGIEQYHSEDMDSEKFIPTPEANKATLVFGITMIIMIAYGIMMKAGASYALIVMLVVAFTTGIAAKINITDILKLLVEGASKMFWLFILFVLYDPFLNFVTESGAFDAIADLLNPLIDVGGAPVFMIAATLIGIFGVSGAAVAQEKVLFDLFLPMSTALRLPVELWALVLLVGSQITFFAYPTGDMVGQMGLARSKDLKSMIKNGLIITFASILYVTIRAVIYQMQ